MFDAVQKILSQVIALDPSREVVVGVSGGPDSLCLLDILLKAGYPVIAACLDHGIRSESAREVAMVHQAAASWGATFVSKAVDTRTYAHQAGLSVETAARQLRYDFLFSTASNANAQAVAVGHTADDQAETILMHLMRGSGLAGLKGMEFRGLTSWSTTIPLVRPLLTIWRREVLEYCLENSLSPAYDATNQNLDYYRNRIRLEVLPYLEQIQPNLRQHLVNMAGTLAVDYELLQSVVETSWQQVVKCQGTGYIAFNRVKFIRQPAAVQRHLIRKAMLSLRSGTQDIERAMIERARFCLERSTARRTCDLGAGLQIQVEQDTAWMIVRGVELPVGEWPVIPQDTVVKLPLPGRLELDYGWVLQAELVNSAEVRVQADVDTHDPYQAWFDAEKITEPLQVRQRQKGDRIQPAGMSGKTVKLSDLMINFKLPYRSRNSWPVVCSRTDILWVPGCRQSFIASPDEHTRHLLKLQLTHLSVNSQED